MLGRIVKILFPVPSTRHPVGGVAVTYEFAIAMADRGHKVTLCHHELYGGDEISSLDEVGWFDFRGDVHHIFVPSGVQNMNDLPSADIFMGYSPALEGTDHIGLPMSFIQGRGIYPAEEEAAAYRAPCPKVCVSKWLTRAGWEEMGVGENEMIHIPLGLRHDQFHLSTPIDERPRRLLFCYNAHPSKGAPLALATLEAVHEARPDVEIVGFGSLAPESPLPDWITYHKSPSKEILAQELYNGVSIFLWTSSVEGFGLPPLEAMTCGAALVTTDNGGSEDYAIKGETALISARRARKPLIRNLVKILDDDGLRQRIATEGSRLGATFTWESSAARMEAFFEDYLRDPAAFGRRRP